MADTDSTDRRDTASHANHDFGEKTISFWGSCVLNFNNITGPAVIVLPLLFQQAGWLLPCLGLLIMWLVSSFAATMLTESMQRIPGNRGFNHRYEYCSLVRHYFGDTWHYVAQIGFNAGLTCSNILSMVITSQVLDSVISNSTGSTFGVSYAEWPPKILRSSPTTAAESHGCNWGFVPTANGFGVPPTDFTPCNQSVISLGYVLAMLVCIPLGYLNLDDNMGFQWASMLAQLLCSFQFAWEFLLRMWPGSESYCPGTGPVHTPLLGSDTLQVVGVCVFAFSYVSTIPSWANEKQHGVSVNKAVWLPSVVGVSLNILLGLLGAWAYNLVDYSHPGGPAPYSGTDDMLNLLDGRADPGVFTCAASAGQPQGPPPVSFITQLCVYIWGIGGYVPGIPILAIMVRYNLQNSGIMGHNAAFFTAVVLPWIITAFFYQAQALLEFCSWVALLCQGFINLLVPILLYRQALILYPTAEEVETMATAQDGETEGKYCLLPCTFTRPFAFCVRHRRWNPITWAVVATSAASDSLSESLLSHQRMERNTGEAKEPVPRGDYEPLSLSPVILQGVLLGSEEHKVNLGLQQPASCWRDQDEVSEDEIEDEKVDAVPRWLRVHPLALANSIGCFVAIAVVVSIVLNFALR